MVHRHIQCICLRYDEKHLVFHTGNGVDHRNRPVFLVWYFSHAADEKNRHLDRWRKSGLFIPRHARQDQNLCCRPTATVCSLSSLPLVYWSLPYFV